LFTRWRIRAYTKKISKTEKPAITYELKAWFNCGDFSLYENGNTFDIYYGPNQQKINVSFEEFKCHSERNGNNVTYYIVFDPVFFGWTHRDKRAYWELYEETFHKITWRKQGFWLDNNTEKPIPTTRRTQIK
jgi:hypothetical protein